MKKQVFLLSLLGLLFVGQNTFAASCDSDCNTDCTKKVTTSNCDKPCSIDHGKTFRRTETTFTNGTPMYVSMFNTNAVRNLDEEDKHGAFEMTVFGGKNTKENESACFFFPYGHTTYSVTGKVTPQKFGKALAWTTAGTTASVGTGTITLDDIGTDGTTAGVPPAGADPTFGTYATADKRLFQSDPVTLQFDPNKDTSVIRPWNFGITFAALFEPGSPSAINTGLGEGLVTNPDFESTICPTYHYSHVGAGFALRYHFSDDKNGWFGSISTSVENVKSLMKLNENVTSARKDIGDEDAYPASDCSTSTRANCSFGDLDVPGFIVTGAADSNLTTVAPVGSVRGSYNETGFPQGDTSPANMEAAFLQSSWKYGKMGCEQSVTRLADIELSVGYQWLCSDCAAANWYAGIVIPTGNKPCAEFVAPAVVGNGQHAGIMVGSQIELLISENEDRSVWYRLDTNGRYLFRNTQKRSFDLKDKEWSRYMMVWENEAAWTAAQDTIADNTFTSIRAFTPGINVFTHDMKVKPRWISRVNQAVYFKSDCFRAELGWNVLARTKECVEFSCPWNTKPALASGNFTLGSGLNNARTIYNDATLSEVNPGVATVSIIPTDSVFLNSDIGAGVTPTTASETYAKFALTEADVNLDSAATPSSLVHTPYLTLGYAWDSDYKPVISVGGSYEFSAGNNRAISQWMVWGKFELAF